MRNARMRGGFGGDGYQSYGDEYAGRGSAGRRLSPQRYGASTITGERARPGDDSSEDERRMQDRERTWSSRERAARPQQLRRRARATPASATTPPPAAARSAAASTRPRPAQLPALRRPHPRGHQRALTDDPVIDASEIEVTVPGPGGDPHRHRPRPQRAAPGRGSRRVRRGRRPMCRTTCASASTRAHATGTEVGDAGAATGNPGDRRRREPASGRSSPPAADELTRMSAASS